VQGIDFWFSVGSTYTYLTVMRLPEVQKESGVRFNWHPFSVRQIMVEMDNIPFATKPAKEAYMWRDVERRAARYGIAISVPAPYPLQHFDLANEIAVLALNEGWCEEYVRSTYRYWFQHGLEAGSDANLERVFDEIGQDRARVLQAVQSEEVGSAYRAATDVARARGVFGAPTFIVGDEVFWGDDRLEDAVAFFRSLP